MAPHEEKKPSASLWRSRPILCGALAFGALVFAIDRGGDALGLSEAHQTIIAAFVLSGAFIAFGALNRTVHGGFAILIGLIALVTAIMFGLMYATDPNLFDQMR